MSTKKIIIVLLLVLLGEAVHAEYAKVNDIVYWFNNEYSTAWVQNILSTDSYVTIPSYVYYRGVDYKVVGIEKNNFNTSSSNTYNASSMFFGDGLLTNIATLYAMKQEEEELPFRDYDYDNYRARIQVLNLPNTLLTIGKGAFDGMKRLKSITIPSSVIKLGGYVFTDYLPNLQSIEILGLPTNGNFSITSVDDEGNPNYYDLVKEQFNIDYCRNLKTFSMPAYEEKIPLIHAFHKANADLEHEAIKYNAELKMASFSPPALKDEVCTDAQTIQEAYNQARHDLNIMFNNCKSYEQLYDSLTNLLKQHPYFDGSTLSSEIPVLDLQETQTSEIPTLFKQHETELWKQYNELTGEKMKNNLRINHPDKYIAGYIMLHPDKKEVIEGLINREYRCQYKNKIYEYVVAYIESGTLAITCRQRYWERDNHLFDSKKEFDDVYNETRDDSEYNTQIGKRRAAYLMLDGMKKYVPGHIKNIHIRKMYKKPNKETNEIIKTLDSLERSYYYDRAVSYLISTLPEVEKEYKKNGQYFSSEIEFFKTYSSESYSKILKKILKDNKKK